MHFLSLSRRRVEAFPPEAFSAELIQAETARVKELRAAGLLVQIWKRGDLPGACIVWEADSEEHARDAIESLPLWKAGMLELVAFVPLETYPGFAAA